jgi:hypothetical protein
VVEGVGLAEAVAGLAVQRHRASQIVGGGRVVAGQPGQQAELVEGFGLTVPVPCVAGRGQRGRLEGGGLVPAASPPQEIAHRRGDLHGVQGPPG